MNKGVHKTLSEEQIANLAKFPAENPNPVLRISKDGTILFANNAGAVVLQTWQRRVGQPLPDECRQRAKEALSSGKVSTFEFNCHDGRTFLVTLAPVVEEGYLNAYGADITERKRIEAALKESEAKYRDLIEGMSDVIYTVDTQGIVTSVSKADRAVFGRDTAEIIGRHFTGFLVPEYIPDATAAFERVLCGESITVETVAFDNSGKQLHIELSLIPTIRNGKVAGAHGIIRNITAGKKLEQALRESEKKYRDIVEKEKDIIYTLDEQGNITFVSPAVERILGYRAEELMGRNVISLIPKQFQDRALARLKELLKSGELTAETILLDKNGRSHFVEYSSTVIEDANKIVGARGIARDVTERKKAEEELRKSEIKYRTLLENLPQKIFLKDAASIYISCNENYARDLKIKAEEITGKTDYNFYPKELAEKYRADDRRIIESGDITDIEEKYILQGQESVVHTVKTPVRDGHGNVAAILGIFWDITERKKAEEALRELELRYRTLFENLPVGVGLASTDGKVLSCNDSMLRMTGYSDAEIKQINLKDAYVSAADRGLLLKELQTNGFVHSFEVQLKRKDGTAYWVSLTIVPFTLSGERSLLTVAVDITDCRRMQANLEESRKELEIRVEQRTAELASANAALKSELAERSKAEQQILTHQRQLQSLALALSLAEERLRRRIAADVHDQISQNLAMSKIRLEALRQAAPSQEFAGSLDEICDLMAEAIKNTRSLTFELSPPALQEIGLDAGIESLLKQIETQHGLATQFQADGQPKRLDQDAQILIFQAVREALANVVKHAQARHVKVISRSLGTGMQVIIEDDGVGFDLSRLQRQDDSIAGFGLFSMRERLKHLDGHVDIVSAPGRGTRVTLVVNVSCGSQDNR